jgi:fumarate reductase subunit D
MRDLDKALADITAIRSQMARGTEFQGYGPVTVAATAVLALIAGGVQALWLPDPGADALTTNVLNTIMLWVATAAVSVVLIGIEMVARSRRIHSGLADEMIHAATEQFIPAGVAGALITVVLYRFAPDTLWMLPGLWQIVFSLGFFASCRSLPRPMFAVGVWYLTTGLATLAFANGAQAFSPWAMAVPFGVGQLLMAAILYRSGANHAET